MSDTATLIQDGVAAVSVRRGGIACDVEYILAQKAKGLPPLMVARMTGRSLPDVMAVMGAPTTAQERPPTPSPKALAWKLVPAKDPSRNWKVYARRKRVMPKPVREIVQLIADRHGITVEDLIGESRVRRVTRPRQEAYAALYGTGRYSLPLIGAWFGGRDHTSVRWGIGRHQERLVSDPDVRAWKRLGGADAP